MPCSCASDDRLLEGGDGVGVEGAAEVRAAEVGGAVRRVAAQQQGCEAALAETAFEQDGVERGVDGVAGEGVVELKVEVLARGDGCARAAEREPRGGGERLGWPGWGGVGH